MKSFILASSSPRRKELLEQAKYNFTIESSQKEERVDEGLKPEEVVQHLAIQKAEDIWRLSQDAVVLGADTIVYHRGMILGKPNTVDEAKSMLEQLSGQTHTVFTGVSICSLEQSLHFYAKTEVSFYSLSEEDISMYIRSGEPFDKAGAYGIQGFGAYLVHSIHGDYYTVMGLPLAKTMRALKQLNISPNI